MRVGQAIFVCLNSNFIPFQRSNIWKNCFVSSARFHVRGESYGRYCVFTYLPDRMEMIDAVQEIIIFLTTHYIRCERDKWKIKTNEKVQQKNLPQILEFHRFEN